MAVSVQGIPVSVQGIPWSVRNVCLVAFIVMIPLFSIWSNVSSTGLLTALMKEANDFTFVSGIPTETQQEAPCSPKINATEDSSSQKEPRPFYDFLSKFNWEPNARWSNDDWQTFFVGLQEFHRQEPVVAINQTCQPPPLPTNVACGAFAPAKLANRTKPVKIGHAIQFGFDVDVLEIHLNELYDVVDKFFIVEFVEAHTRLFRPKELTWEHVKNQDRFRKFHDKVVHFVLDDIDKETLRSNSGMWAAESHQEQMRWNKILQWNSLTQYFGPDDVIGFGDADEIPSRDNVNILRHCQMTSPSLDVGIWFPFGRVNWLFPAYWSPRGYKYALGDPTFWTFRSASDPKNFKSSKARYPNRRRGKSESFLLGGMHMTHYGFLPYQITKRLTASEATNGPERVKSAIGQAYRNNTLKELDEAYSLPHPGSRPKVVERSSVDSKLWKDIVHFPWFYDCNRDRYPRWEGKPDLRLGGLTQ